MIINIKFFKMKKILFVLLLQIIMPKSFSQTSAEFVNEGIRKQLLKDYKGAFKDFSNASLKDPTNAEAYFYEGVLCAKPEAGAFREFTMMNFNKAIELNPNYLEAYFYRGLEKFKLNDFRGAISDYDKAIEINKNHYESFAYRGIAKQQLNDNSGALDDYNKAIQINPKYAFGYGVRGIFKFSLGQKDKACLDFSKAGELGDKLSYEYITQYCN
jgi:tetratricopeptide (TPR) repeat protein